MMMEALVALAGLGFCAGYLAAMVVVVRPLAARSREVEREEARELRRRVYRQRARARFGLFAVPAVPVADDHNGSRKATDLRVVS